MTASKWIQRHARDRIIILLQSQRYTIAEIADEVKSQCLHRCRNICTVSLV